jgi:multidrug efflux pump subunit AcrA (membrane-fusion protein)
MNPSGTIEPATIPPAREPSASPAAAAAAASAKLRHAAILAAVLIVIGAVAGLVPRWLHRTALRAETRELAIQTVSVVSPVPGKAVVGLTLPAEAKALVEAPIYARTSGYLKRYLVDIGAVVKAGDLLAEIDTPELNQELAQSRAQLNQAQAALALAKTTAARWAELLKTASVSDQEAAEKQADLSKQHAPVFAGSKNSRPSNASPPHSPAPSRRGAPTSASSLRRAAARNSSAWPRPAPCACLCACRRRRPQASRPARWRN